MKKDFLKDKELFIYIKMAIELAFSIFFYILYFPIRNTEGNYSKDLYHILYIVLFIVAIANIRHFKFGQYVGDRIKHGMGIIFGGFVRMIVNIFSLTGGSRRNGNMKIKGYVDTQTHLNDKVAFVKKKVRYPKYKTMDNRMKVRYLYYKATGKWQRMGYKYEASMTPNENEVILMKNGHIKKDADKAFLIYNKARYSDKSEVSESDVEILKKNIIKN